MTNAPHILDMEDDVRGAVEMADAVYRLVEAGDKHGLGPEQVNAILRCVCHLQDHTVGVRNRFEAITRQAA